MTNATLISRVQSLAGEGFEDWDVSTRAAIRESAIQLVKSGMFSPADYAGLVIEKSVASGVTTALVPYSILIPTGYELINWIEIIKDPVAEGVANSTVQIVSYNEYMAITLNSNLIRTGQIYAYLTYTTVPTLAFSVDFASASDAIKYKALMWWDALLTASALELSTYFSDPFIDMLIQLSVEKLKAEIDA